MSARQLEILCAVPEPVGLRADRLLANELGLSRSCIQRLEGGGALVAFPQGSRLRRAVRDGMRLLVISLQFLEPAFLEKEQLSKI